MNYALGIDLGGSSVKAVAVTPGGELLREENQPFDAEVPRDWARVIRQIVLSMESAQGAPARAIGLSAPGLAAADGRSIAYMPGRLEGLVGLDWTQFLQSECRGSKADVAPSQPECNVVPVLNDAHAALLGEAWLGAARGCRHAILLTLGTGVGGAAMVDGQLLKGAVGRAGHLGHACLNPDAAPDICGMPGSLETMIGNYNIAARSSGRFTTTHELVAAHQSGDPEAAKIWLRSVRALACAIGSFINVLDPEVVIVGGGIARAGDALFEPLRRFTREVEWMVTPEPVKILPAQLGELAGAYGAARNGLDRSR